MGGEFVQQRAMRFRYIGLRQQLQLLERANDLCFGQ